MLRDMALQALRALLAFMTCRNVCGASNARSHPVHRLALGRTPATTPVSTPVASGESGRLTIPPRLTGRAR